MGRGLSVRNQLRILHYRTKSLSICVFNSILPCAWIVNAFAWQVCNQAWMAYYVRHFAPARLGDRWLQLGLYVMVSIATLVARRSVSFHTTHINGAPDSGQFAFVMLCVCGNIHHHFKPIYTHLYSGVLIPYFFFFLFFLIYSCNTIRCWNRLPNAKRQRLSDWEMRELKWNAEGELPPGLFECLSCSHIVCSVGK